MAISRIPALVLVLALAGCSNRYQRNHMSMDRDVSEKPLVAVMPFQGVSESPGSGLIVADIMANELYASGGYIVVTPEVTAARAAPREGEILSPEETGKLVGAPLILTGRVTEYTYKSGVGEQPAVGVTARLIETATGRVLWSASRARTGSAAWFQEDSLSLLASRICRSLVASLNGEAFEYGWGGPEDEYSTKAYPLEQPERGKTGPASPAGPARPAATVRLPAAYRSPAPARPAGEYGALPSGSPRVSERPEGRGDPSFLFVPPERRNRRN
jgi:TolB-like protein